MHFGPAGALEEREEQPGLDRRVGEVRELAQKRVQLTCIAGQVQRDACRQLCPSNGPDLVGVRSELPGLFASDLPGLFANFVYDWSLNAISNLANNGSNGDAR